MKSLKMLCLVTSICFAVNVKSKLNENAIQLKQSHWIYIEIKKKIDLHVKSTGEVFVLGISNDLQQNRYYIIDKDRTYQYRLEYAESFFLKNYMGFYSYDDSCFVKNLITPDSGCIKNEENTENCNDCSSVKLQQWKKRRMRTKLVSEDIITSKYHGNYWRH